METDDDNFMHITCHLDEKLIEKIEKGEYVELEKLLVKPKHLRYGHDNKVDTKIVRGGLTYVLPESDKEPKITNVKKWEQAFRVYAAVYTKANPTRAAEIWQYVHIINTAAMSYSWENVAQYDFTFRHLMAKKPYRNWGTTYNQMWNLTLRDPVNRSNQFSMASQSSTNKKGIKACWKFNRGHCPRGKECRFEHRCAYCGATSHGSNSCQKKANKKAGKGGGNTSTPSKHETNNNSEN